MLMRGISVRHSDCRAPTQVPCFGTDAGTMFSDIQSTY